LKFKIKDRKNALYTLFWTASYTFPAIGHVTDLQHLNNVRPR